MNVFLLVGAVLSMSAAVLHIGCILFGGPWYRFMGAGEEMARMSEAGHWYPALLTSGIAAVLVLWSLYALSGAGVIARLPLLWAGLCAIAGIYVLRGIAFVPLAPFFPENSLSFWLWSSLICLGFGVIHVLGIRQAWPSLAPPNPEA